MRIIVFIILGISWEASTEKCHKTVMNFDDSWYMYERKINVMVCHFFINERELRHCDKKTALPLAMTYIIVNVPTMLFEKMKTTLEWMSYSEDSKSLYAYERDEDGTCRKVTTTVKISTTEADFFDDTITLNDVPRTYSDGYFSNSGEVFVWESDQQNFLKQQFSCRDLSSVGSVTFTGYISDYQSNYYVFQYQDYTFVEKLTSVDKCGTKISQSDQYPIVFAEKNLTSKDSGNSHHKKFDKHFQQQADAYRDIYKNCNFSTYNYEPQTNVRSNEEIEGQLSIILYVLGFILCYILVQIIISLYNTFINYSTLKKVNYKSSCWLLQAQINRFYHYRLLEIAYRIRNDKNEVKTYERPQKPENNYEYVTSEYDFNYLYDKNAWSLSR